MTRPAADVLEDLEWLDEACVGALEAARRTDFPSAEAMERWLHRQRQYPLWLRLKARDPQGIHSQPARRLQMTENTHDPIAALISRAQKSSRKRTRNKADKVNDLIADLRQQLDIEAHEDEAQKTARRDIERLHHELAAAKALLRGATTGVAAPTDGPAASEIREWARNEDVECPERGRVPESVREAYLAATEQVA